MDSRQDYDVLGFIYEYLISNFAANAGKKAGEFYTPSGVSPADERNRRMAFAGARADQDLRSNIRFRLFADSYWPVCGSAQWQSEFHHVLRAGTQGEHLQPDAYESGDARYSSDNIVARNGDTLEEDDWPWFDTLENKEETYNPLFVDAVVSNPPYS